MALHGAGAAAPEDFWVLLFLYKSTPPGGGTFLNPAAAENYEYLLAAAGKVTRHRNGEAPLACRQ